MRVQLSGVIIEQMAIHRVGNKHRAERNYTSSELYYPDEAMRETLVAYFTKGLKRADDLHRFSHEEELSYNELYGFAKTIFEDPERFLTESVNVLEHLYRQSIHPNIKSGDLFVVYFSDVVYEDEVVNAIGVFKSERKHSFLQVNKIDNSLQLNKEQGISLEKIDKACLILNTEQADGFRVLSIDNNVYDTEYWLRRFLNVEYVQDERFHTRSYLELCDSFAKEVVVPATDQREQLQFLSNSIDYFNREEEFNFDNFTQQVIPDPKMAQEFRGYQRDYALEDVNNFPIAKAALKTAQRKFKNNIQLDTNIEIRLDFKNPEASRQYLEKDFDEEKGMYYYKVYFNEEL